MTRRTKESSSAWRVYETYLEAPAEFPVEQPTKFELAIKSENRQADRPHNSAQRAGAGGSGDQVTLLGGKGSVVGVVLCATLFALCSSAEAQQPKRVPRIGFLMGGSSGADSRVEAFRQGLHDLGYVEGKNIAIEWRFAEGQEARVAPLVAELVHMRVDIIVTDGNQTTSVAKSETKTIPIVMASASDPVEMGTVTSLARPGGNITGLSNLIDGLSAKRLEILTETLPGISRVGAIWNPENPQAVSSFKEEQIAAQALAVQLQSLEVHGPERF